MKSTVVESSSGEPKVILELRERSLSSNPSSSSDGESVTSVELTPEKLHVIAHFISLSLNYL